MKKLILLLVLLLIWGCSPLKKINSPYGKIYRFQKKAIDEAREFKAPRPIKLP